VKSVTAADFVERVALTLAKVDECDFEKDPERYRLLARAAMAELQKPTPDMISAAYEAVRFDESWAINTGRDFKKGVKAMIDAALHSPNKGSE
jgi:hypothetical protein